MLASYAVGVLALVVLAAAWVGVQSAWRKAFPGVGSDPDGLAGRMGCRGCGAAGDCERRLPDRAGSAEEETR